MNAPLQHGLTSTFYDVPGLLQRIKSHGITVIFVNFVCETNIRNFVPYKNTSSFDYLTISYIQKYHPTNLPMSYPVLGRVCVCVHRL